MAARKRVNCFESSTRTRTSFEVAGKRHGVEACTQPGLVELTLDLGIWCGPSLDDLVPEHPTPRTKFVGQAMTAMELTFRDE